MWDIGFWWCCINPREREVLRGTIEGIILTANVGIPLAVWMAFWEIHYPNGQAFRDAFLSIYKLEIVEIVIDPEEPPVEVVRALDGLVYVEWGAWLLNPLAACLDGCQQSVVGV